MKQKKTGERININRGVTQGDLISPKLFIKVLQNKTKDLPWSKQEIGRKFINYAPISHLRLAIDVVLLSEYPVKLNKMICELQDPSCVWP